MKIKTNVRAGIAYPPPVSRCVGVGGGGGGDGDGGRGGIGNILPV